MHCGIEIQTYTNQYMKQPDYTVLIMGLKSQSLAPIPCNQTQYSIISSLKYFIQLNASAHSS